MKFEEILVKYKKIIDKSIYSHLNNSFKNKQNSFLKIADKNIMNYMSNGGKRLRPIALLMAYTGIQGKTDSEIINTSLCVEFLHNSTLIHDDIMDEDEYRRNKPALHNIHRKWYLDNSVEKKYYGPIFNRASSKFAVSNAIIDGNILLTLAFDSIINSKFKNKNIALKILNDAYKIVNDGQILDILFANKNVSEKEYIDMIQMKTGNLFLASIQIGLVLGHASKKDYLALSDYAKNVFLAFQIQDDILAIKESSGDKFDTDIKNAKNTLLIIKANEYANRNQIKIMNKYLGKENATKLQIKKVIEIINETGALEYANNFAAQKIKYGVDILKKSNLSSRSKLFFKDLATYLISRSN